MKILENQTLYQCEYCRKRLLTKAGANLHENEYCSNDKSPRGQKVKAQQDNCEHKNTETVLVYLDGDSMPVPDYDICTDCNLKYV